ncbi:MAG TPA: DUF5069 domain-containing protein [Roseimicrobium sp.]|nr:DUF5069 domain-containing protein [Roseimicrobium sp.]
MNSYRWSDQFRKIYERAVAAYNSGKQRPKDMFTAEDVAFLATIGCSAQELFDFVEDYCRGGEPSYEFTLLVTAARRDYFLTIQKGVPSGKMIDSDKLPAKAAAVDGIPWLPRIIEKAKAKLRGEMPPELMYGCGGDRPFLESHNVDAAEFLREVWAANGDDRRVIDWLKAQSKKG